MLFCFKKSQVVLIPYHITDLYKVHISNLNPEYNLYLSVSFYSLKNKQKTHKSSPRRGQWHCRVAKYTIPKYGMRIMFELKETQKSRYKKAHCPPDTCLNQDTNSQRRPCSPLYQEGLQLITRHNFRPLWAQGWHQRDLHTNFIDQPLSSISFPYICLPTICCPYRLKALSFVLSLTKNVLLLC